MACHTQPLGADGYVSSVLQHSRGYVCINITTNFLSPNYFCGGIAISITYSESVSIALIIQNAKRMRRNILSSVACPELPHFSKLFHKRQDFQKKKLNLKYALFSTNFA